jgi:hypothetical protein
MPYDGSDGAMVSRSAEIQNAENGKLLTLYHAMYILPKEFFARSVRFKKMALPLFCVVGISKKVAEPLF